MQITCKFSLDFPIKISCQQKNIEKIQGPTNHQIPRKVKISFLIRSSKKQTS